MPKRSADRQTGRGARTGIAPVREKNASITSKEEARRWTGPTCLLSPRVSTDDVADGDSSQMHVAALLAAAPRVVAPRAKSTNLGATGESDVRRFGVLDRQEPNVPRVVHALADASL